MCFRELRHGALGYTEIPYPANTKSQEPCIKDTMPILHSGNNAKCGYVNSTSVYRNFDGPSVIAPKPEDVWSCHAPAIFAIKENSITFYMHYRIPHQGYILSVATVVPNSEVH